MDHLRLSGLVVPYERRQLPLRSTRTSIEQINTSTGTVSYLHHDQAGSTRLITGSTGAVTGKCTYGAYGAPTCEGTTTTPLDYDAQYTSSDTGLIYLRNRVYDPATAQFLTVDPVVAVTEAPCTYAEDNPLNQQDSTGLSSEGEVCLGPFCYPVPSPPSLPQAGQEALEGAEWFAATGGASLGVIGALSGGAILGGGDVAAGGTAIGLTLGGTGFLGDAAAALASSGCG